MSAELGYLGLGSNLGDRRALLQAAAEDLWAHGVQALASSSVYETEPVGEVLDQPAFLNACLRIETALGPEALLDACKAVERALGRAAGGVRHGPRPVDVDVLLLGTEAYDVRAAGDPAPRARAPALRARAAARARPGARRCPTARRWPPRSRRSTARTCAAPGRRSTCAPAG